MSVPKSVTKVTKEGITIVSNVDRASYTIKELSRAALRDVGKFLCAEFRRRFYLHFRRRKNTKKGVKKSHTVWTETQYWVRWKREEYPNLQVGVKPNAFYGMYQEIGSSKQPKLGLLSASVKDNIPEIIKIESQYLSALEDEAEALSLISEEDYGGS